jgi:hypothetical protein
MVGKDQMKKMIGVTHLDNIDVTDLPLPEAAS